MRIGAKKSHLRSWQGPHNLFPFRVDMSPRLSSKLHLCTKSALTIQSMRGLTLVEVAVAAVVFALGAIGISALLTNSYHLSRLARYRTDARAVLVSFADQFERLQVADAVSVGGSSASVSKTRYLFTVSSTETGVGLKPLTSLSDENQSVSPTTPGTEMEVYLGGSHPLSKLPAIADEAEIKAVDNAIVGTVTRTVVALDPATGATGLDKKYTAGKLLLGTFTVRYTLGSQTFTQSLSVIRTAD